MPLRRKVKRQKYPRLSIEQGGQLFDLKFINATMLYYSTDEEMGLKNKTLCFATQPH